MKARFYITISGLIFATVCLGHVLRVMYDWPLTIGAYDVSLGLSWVALLVAGGMLVWAMAILTGKS